jgi:GNAT superfamily N-acetyltransferase
MKLIIRKWKPADIPAMVKHTFEWGFETTPEQLTEQLTRIDTLDNAGVFVAEMDGRVAGRIFVAEHLTVGSTPFAEVHSLIVEQACRRQGIGTALMEKARQWSAARGFKVLRLRTNSQRTEANSFYPALGFKLEKQQNVYTIHLETGISAPGEF